MDWWGSSPKRSSGVREDALGRIEAHLFRQIDERLDPVTSGSQRKGRQRH